MATTYDEVNSLKLCDWDSQGYDYFLCHLIDKPEIMTD
jgi:hypothetical protein